MSKRVAGERFAGFLPERVAIDTYGAGGFRFRDMSHRGSLLVLSDGMHAWEAAPDRPPDEHLLVALAARIAAPEFLIVGTGRAQHFPSAAVRRAFAEAGLAIDVMDTGAACRTYNVLLGEQRPVAAAFVAVE
ncbi:MAG TPA: Mth938-like domain-containing protein [Hyphomicrobiaceae bacterium]|mgnify:CR=1 FL=1|nr:Mth938-like domain-containing protein [Hyphomicrobiaceae bacterium]